MIIPHRVDGPLKGIVLSGGHFAIHPHDRMTLQFAGHATLQRLQDFVPRNRVEAASQLSERERECLSWVAVGKSDWEIGEILTINAKTVNIYVERAKLKFNATTRTHAVVVALRLGLIDL